MLLLRVPQDSPLAGKSLRESRIGNVLGMRVLFIKGEDGSLQLPKTEEKLRAGDCLVVEGRKDDLLILRALAELEIERRSLPDFHALESEQVGWIETVLSPHSNLPGKTLRQLHFREKYGLSVLAIWRQGKIYYTDLRNMALNFGDALLIYGTRAKLQVLGREPDFIVLTQSAQEIMRHEKMKLAGAIMILVFLPVVMGWIPIYIAVIVGAAFMVLSCCLTMEEAYRFIEWKAVFLIAGMFPLGTALDKTGAAAFLASGVVAVAGPFGPTAVLFGMVILTFFATCFIPTAALVVLLSPIILQASANMGMSPYPLMMAMAMAASASFMTPISHPANILVMGPGGYRFSDYIKIGGSLTLVVLLAIMLILPIFWPLGP
jgi:di/tricarboxylate transporter